MGRSRWRFMLMLLCLLLVAPVMPPPAAAQSPIDGKPTLGDPYFPKLGNSGYDVQHYDITLRINPKRKRISGTTVITLTPTAPLRSFTLDFIGYRVSEVTVNGVEAGHSRRDNKLRITPESPLAEGAEATVEIVYGGKSATPSKYSGWLWFKRGGALLSSQPSGARTLFPSNDHPSDKATFHYDLTTPRGLTAVANGLPTEQAAPDGWQRVTWYEAAPYPTYAALVAVGNFRLIESTGPSGVPILNALPAKHVPRLERRLKNQGRIVQVLEERFGPYPYGSIGAIVVPLSSPDAMEAATRPTYPGIKWARKGRDFEQTVAHEIAHMWLGNSVTGANWRNIWLNEGFATYGELIWIAHKRKVPIGALFRKDSNVFTYASSMYDVKPGNPGRDRIWSYSVYNRGAMTLEALRRTVGDEDFNTIMRRWVSEYGIGNPAGDGTANTRNFIDLAEEVSGRDLDKFFKRWLYKRDLPKLPKDRTKSTLEAGDVSDRLRDLPRVGPDKGGMIDKLEDVPAER